MKLLTLLPALLASAYAESSSSAASSPSEDPTAASTKTPDPTPAGALWTSVWDSTTLSPYTTSCASTRTFAARTHKLAALYPDLEKYASGLKKFYANTHYPGSWRGEDKHGLERELLQMETAALPEKVRRWIEEQGDKQTWFAVLGSVTFFAPGAVYPTLPLWVDGVEGVGCEGVFDGLEAYANEPKDGAVIGKIAHAGKQEGEVEFTIEAMRVELKDGARDEL